MANEQHLKLINEAIERHDIEIWNRWRKENPDIRPDLSGSHLKRADLKNAALHGVIFRKANLRGTDLSYADLSGSDFSSANLMRTHFCTANLVKANFSGANLTEANLSEANLSEANFSDTLLIGALFLEADLNKANFEANAKELSPSQIRTAKNWETAYFCKSILEDLGMPPNHNEILRKGIEEKKPNNFPPKAVDL